MSPVISSFHQIVSTIRDSAHLGHLGNIVILLRNVEFIFFQPNKLKFAKCEYVLYFINFHSCEPKINNGLWIENTLIEAVEVWVDFKSNPSSHLCNA